MKKILQQLVIFSLSLFIGVGIAFAQASVTVTASVTIVANPAILTTPNFTDIPASACNSFLPLTGTADPNVDIYVNNIYKTTSAVDGVFTIVLGLTTGNNEFNVQARDGGRESGINNFTIVKYSVCTNTFTPEAYIPNIPGKKDKFPNKEIKHLEDINIDKYIEEILDIKDSIALPTKSLSNQDNDSNKNTGGSGGSPFDSFPEEIVNPYQDLDNDGISDLIERVLGFNRFNEDVEPGTPNVKLDNIETDIREITSEKRVDTNGYEMFLNLYENATFTCNNLLLHGYLEPDQKLSESALKRTQITFCLDGQGKDTCYNIFPDKYGKFLKRFETPLKEGNYTVDLKVNHKLMDTFDVSCFEENEEQELIMLTIDNKKVYERKPTRFLDKNIFYVTTDTPYVEGIGPSNDLVFSFWLQNNEQEQRFILLSDIYGYFKMKPPKNLNTFFGFGKARVLSYALDAGAISSVYDFTFYIFDWRIILLELLILMMTYIIYKYYRKRKIENQEKDADEEEAGQIGNFNKNSNFDKLMLLKNKESIHTGEQCTLQEHDLNIYHKDNIK